MFAARTIAVSFGHFQVIYPVLALAILSGVVAVAGAARSCVASSLAQALACAVCFYYTSYTSRTAPLCLGRLGSILRLADGYRAQIMFASVVLLVSVSVF